MKCAAYLYNWVLSFRLKTLVLAVSSALIGNTLAYWQHAFSWSIFCFILITASLLQILSNLANSYGDILKDAGNTDDADRIGLKRGIHSGGITLYQLRVAIITNAVLCIFSGLILLALACRTSQELIGFVIIGFLSIIAAITYTVGKYAYGYTGLGDVSVLIFFGLVSVIGSFYLQAGQFFAVLLLPAVASGLLSILILNMNNLRDIENDKKGHKRTLVVLLGKPLGIAYHCCLFLFAFFLFSLFSYFYLQSAWSWLFLIMLPFYIFYTREIILHHSSEEISPVFPVMIKLVFLTNILYALGIILSVH